MKTVQLNIRINSTLKRAIDDFCQVHGVARNHFVQEALLDRLEELEDVEDLKKLRHEPTRQLADVLEDLKLDGAL